jgi:hypothetical protein
MGAVVTARSFASPHQRLIRYYASVLGTRAEARSGGRVEGR